MRRDDHRAAPGEQEQRAVFLARGLVGVERDIIRRERAACTHRTRETVGDRRPDRDFGRLAEHGVRHDRRAGNECDGQQTARHAQAEQ